MRSCLRCLALVCLLLIACWAVRAQDGAGGRVLSEDGRYHGLGLLPQDPRTVAGWHEARPDETALAAAPVPLAVTNSEYLPPVGDQGVQGSCVAWACAYYNRTYMEARKTGWDPSLAAHQFSPAYLYNQGYAWPDRGMYFSDAGNLMCALGCTTLDRMPYNQYDHSTWPTEGDYKQAMSYRIASTTWFSTTSPGGLDKMKSLLAAGGIGFMGINIYHNFDSISSYGYNYCLADVQAGWTIRGGHATTVIGYDDTHVTNDGVGAFRCVNSWGTAWGDSGYYWLSYQAVTDASCKLCQGNYFYFQDLDEEPTLAARFRIQYGQFRDLFVLTGTGSPDSPASSDYVWYLISYWDASSRGLPIAAPAGYVWVDVSGLRSAPGDQVFLAVKDNYNTSLTGQLSDFTLVDLCTGQSLSSAQTPVVIPNAPQWVSASVTQPAWSDITIVSQPAGQTIVRGETAVLGVSVSDPGAATYQWYVGQPGDTSDPVAYAQWSSFTTPPLEETTTYWVRVSDPCGYVDSDAATVEVLPPLSVSVVAQPPSGVVPVSVYLTAEAAGGSGPYSYGWNFGDGTTGTGAALYHTYGMVGHYTATVTVTDAGGRTSASSVAVVAQPVPPSIAAVVKLGSPFRLRLAGANFHPGCVVMVGGTPAPTTAFKSGAKLLVKGGAGLKAMVPKGVPVEITVRNTDDGGVSAPFTFTR